MRDRAPAGPDREADRRGRAPTAATLLPAAGAALVTSAAYLAAFHGPMHALGPDTYFYIWSARAPGPWAEVMLRPGFPGMAAWFDALGLAPGGVGPLVIGVALAIVLGLVIADIARRAVGSPGWVLGPVTVAVATWSGTWRLGVGYLANLLAAVCAAFAFRLALEERSRHRSALATAGFVAAGLAHLGFAPLWIAIAGAWSVASRVGPWSSADDRRSGVAMVAALGGSAIAGVVLIVLSGHPLTALSDLGFSSPRFISRLWEFGADIASVAPISLAGAVVTAAWIVRRGGRADAGAGRLALAWLVVCAAAVAAMAVDPGLPGHRALLLALPIAVPGGMLIAAATRAIDQTPIRLARVAAVVACVLLAALLADVQLRGLTSAASLAWRDRYVPMRLAAAQLHRGAATRPAIVVVEPTRILSARRWEIRRNVVRALAPDPAIVELHVGPLRSLVDRRRPTFQGLDGELAATLRAVQEQTWPAVHRLFEHEPRIIVVRDVVSTSSWALAASSEVGGRGVETVDPADGLVPVPVPETSAARALPASIAILAVLALVGLGVGRAAWGPVRGWPAGRFVLAPAAGSVLVVLVTASAILVGIAPGGAPVHVAVGLAAGAGWAWTRRAASAPILPQEIRPAAAGTGWRRNHASPESHTAATTAPTASTTGVDAP